MGDAAIAHRTSPEAVLAREESQSNFAGMAPRQAAALAARAFPQAITRAEAPPELPAGAKITGYPSVNAAQVTLSEGKHEVLESTGPLAMEASPGHREAIDLALRESGGAYQAIRSPLDLSIPKHLSAGITLPDSGVTLTPADWRGRPLQGAEGQTDGATVFYGATATNSDIAIKPTVFGVAVNELLRSQGSPTTLYLRVGLPHGARLVQAHHGSGAVQVIAEGQPLATILPPGAVDAAGAPVPVSMRLRGRDLVVVSVDTRPGEYQYPIEVDPETTDSQLANSVAGKPTNWAPLTGPGGVFHPSSCDCTPELLSDEANGASYGATEYGGWAYHTNGDSDISELTGTTYAYNIYGEHGERSHVMSYYELLTYAGAKEEQVILSGYSNPYYAEKTESICAPSTYRCRPGTGSPANSVHFEQAAQEACAGCSFKDELWAGHVYISQPEGSYAHFNYSSPNIEYKVPSKTEAGKMEPVTRPNVLYLGAKKGVYCMIRGSSRPLSRQRWAEPSE
ncbi:MAG: hypothetical protein ACYDA6_03160 [Solirubrobacteraceae bacterium]